MHNKLIASHVSHSLNFIQTNQLNYYIAPLKMSTKASCKTKIKPNPILKLPQGELEGFVAKSRSKYYYGFYGIPYAKKPKRFEPPEKWEESWGGTLDATKARDRCSQTSLITRKVFGSEDCRKCKNNLKINDFFNEGFSSVCERLYAKASCTRRSR
jgi:hypothetical protein